MAYLNIQIGDEDYVDYEYEVEEKALCEALAKITAEWWFTESCQDAKLKEIIVKGLTDLIDNEDEVKDAIFNMDGMREALEEHFYNDASDEYNDNRNAQIEYFYDEFR